MNFDRLSAYPARSSNSPEESRVGDFTPRGPAVEHLAAALPSLERAVERLPEALHLQTDHLTGMYLKNLLYSSAGRALIERAIPGEKRFVLFDCQHAGAANAFGAGGSVDRYFESLRSIFQRAALEFGIPHIPLRLGGDEFAVVMPADERSLRFLKRAAEDFEKSREEHLGDGPAGLGAYVIERSTMRTARSEYRRWTEREGAPYTASGFFDYMNDNFVPAGPSAFISRDGFREYLERRGVDKLIADLLVDPNRRSLGEAVRSGFLQKYIAIALVSGLKAPAGRFSWCAVDIGAAPRWEEYHLAEGLAAKRIQASKDRVVDADSTTALTIDPALRIKHHEDAVRQAFLERERKYAELRGEIVRGGELPQKRAADLYTLTMLAVSDPNIPGVVRGNLIREVPAEVILGRQHDGPIYALIVNAKSFGVVNNSAGYAEADAMLKDIVSAAACEFAPFAVVRQGGGRLVLLGTQPFDVAAIPALQLKLEGVIHDHTRGEAKSLEAAAPLERMLVEYGERFALNSRWRGGVFTFPTLDFGSCDVALAMVKTAHDQPLDLGSM